MFHSLKLYVDQVIDQETLLNDLVVFRYQKAHNVIQEGDFTQRGEIIDVFPINYEDRKSTRLNSSH